MPIQALSIFSKSSCQFQQKDKIEVQKSNWDLFKKYLSRQGPADFLDGLSNLFDFVQYIPLSPESKQKAALAGEKVQFASDMASWLDLPVKVQELASSIGLIQETKALPQAHPKRNDKISTHTQKVIVQGLSLAGTSADAISTLQSSGLADLGRAAPLLEGVSYSATAITEGCSLREDIEKLEKKNQALATVKSQKQSELLEKQKKLFQLKIVRGFFSVLWALGSLSYLLFGPIFLSSVAMGLMLLFFSTAYVVMNISVYFFEQKLKIDEKHAKNQKSTNS